MASLVQNRDLIAKEIGGKGRGIIASKPFHRGELLLACDPYVAVLNTSSRSFRCGYCFKEPKEKMQRCSGCKIIWYCGRECQKLDWGIGHNLECKSIQRMITQHKMTVETANSSLTPTILLMARLLRLKQLEQTKGKELVQQHTYKDVEALKSHREEHPAEKLELYAQMCRFVVDFIGIDELQTTSQELIELFCKFTCNNFNISDEEMRYIGIGLYPTAALINHSCDANCVAVFEGRKVYIRAIEDIPSGVEVTISYIEVADTTLNRNTELRSTFFFICNCNRCLYSEELDKMLEEVVSSPDAEEILSEAYSLQQKGRSARETGNLDKAFEYLRASFEKYSKVCHPLHKDKLSVTMLLTNLCIDRKDWENAVKYCQITVDVYSKIYKPSWPLLGLQYFLLGRLLWYLQRTREAVVALKKAASILTISHGGESPTIIELLRLLNEAQSEEAYRAEISAK